MLLGISWLWWATGTFGLIGTGLMLWLAPTVLVQIVEALLSFFLTSRYGNMIAVGLIVFFVADVNRSLRDEHDFAARTASFEQAQQQRDDTIAHATRLEVLKEIADQTAANTQTDTEVKEFHDALPIVTTDACNDVVRVGANAGRLRTLAGAGAPLRRPVRAQGVPKARKKAAGT